MNGFPAMGHSDLRTPLKYRHLRPEHERPAIEQLGKTLRLAKIVTVQGLRPPQPRPEVGEIRSTLIATDENGRHSNGRFRLRK